MDIHGKCVGPERGKNPRSLRAQVVIHKRADDVVVGGKLRRRGSQTALKVVDFEGILPRNGLEGTPVIRLRVKEGYAHIA